MVEGLSELWHRQGKDLERDKGCEERRLRRGVRLGLGLGFGIRKLVGDIDVIDEGSFEV